MRKIPGAFGKCRIPIQSGHRDSVCGAWIVVGFGLAGPPQRLLPARREAGRVQVQKLVCRNLHTLRTLSYGAAMAEHKGCSLNPPPRLLVEDNGASHPLRESRGGSGMVSSSG